MRRMSMRAVLLAALIVINAVVLYALMANRSGGLQVSFLDVGQGDAIFIESPSGAQVLIDGGPDAKALRELRKLMPFYDRSIDVVVATHPDADHITGLVDVMSRYRIGVMLEPGVESGTALDDALRNAAAQSGTEIIEARRGMTVQLGGGAKLFILFPDRDPGAMETNAASIVAKLMYGKTSILLTGDSPKGIESYLAQLDGGKLDSDLLKVGHHGSDTSTGGGFAALVSPSVAVISAGKDNRFGHPHAAVLDTLAAAGASVVGTYDEGTITFVSDGKTILKK